MRYWLLTSTFYGNWLPGDPRGFVGRVREHRPYDDARAARRQHDRFGEAFDADLSGLSDAARLAMKGPAVRVGPAHAARLIGQFRQTADFRRWRLLATAVMSDHVHWVTGLHDNQHGRNGLQAFKAYGSRVLNRTWGAPPGGRRWTSKGSARLLPDEGAIAAACDYVAHRQRGPLAVWTCDGLDQLVRGKTARPTDVGRS